LIVTSDIVFLLRRSRAYHLCDIICAATSIHGERLAEAFLGASIQDAAVGA
jgi:hypothetical protein